MKFAVFALALPALALAQVRPGPYRSYGNPNSRSANTMTGRPGAHRSAGRGGMRGGDELIPVGVRTVQQ